MGRFIGGGFERPQGCARARDRHVEFADDARQAFLALANGGETALKQLNRLIRGETNLAPIEFPTNLIVRQSCGCPMKGTHG